MEIKYRIGVMPGPWPDDEAGPGAPGGPAFLWRLATDVVPDFHRR